MNQHSGFASVRSQYGVPAHYGTRVTYRGYPEPISGVLISCTGAHLYLRRDDDGKRFGPIHPCEVDYGDSRDYTAECNAIIEIRNDWLNMRITTDEYNRRVKAVRSGESQAVVV